MAVDNLTPEQIELAKQLLEIRDQEAKAVKEVLKARKELANAEALGLDNIQELRDNVEIYTQSMNAAERQMLELQDEVDKYTEAQERAQKQTEKTQKAMETLGAGVDKVRGGIDTLTKSNLGSILSFKGFVEAVIDGAHKLQDLDVGLARATGRTKDFQDNLRDLTIRNSELSISLSESAEIITGLSTGMTRFNLVGDQQQRVLENIAARFKRLGADADVFAPALDRINFGFGMTGEAAANAARSLEDMSDEVGRPLQGVIADLNEIGPTLARFGRGGLDVFRKLNFQARELGLTVRQAFDFTELFDTFESAANVAGRLNAQLGLQLNSVEILRASSEERLDILKQEFAMSGKNFMSMDRRQKQMIASILNTDEETAARLLGDGMDISAFQQQAAQEKSLNDVVTFQERTTAAIEQLTLQLAQPVQDLLKASMEYFQYFYKFGPALIGALAAAKLAGGALSLGSKLTTAGAAGALGTGTLATMGGGVAASLGAIPIIGQVAGGLAQAGYEYQKTGSVGRAAGRGLGGIGGGLAGAAAGAAIGSVVPVIGTAIGGIIGGVLGQFGGGLLATSIMGEAVPATEKSDGARQLKQAQISQQSKPVPAIEVKEMTLPIRMVVDGREFSPIIERAMNVHLNPTTPN